MFILLPSSQHLSVTQSFANYLLTSSSDLPLTSKQIDNRKANLLWCEISFNSPEEGNRLFPKCVVTTEKVLQIWVTESV
jgi:hypothetical protein